MSDDVAWLTHDQEQLWRRWLQTSVRQHVAIAQDLKTAGLSEPDFEVLVCLTDEADGGLRMSELADRLAWERSRLSHQVRRMARRGLVVRHDVEEDARGARVCVTDDGRSLIERAAPSHVATVRGLFFDRLDDADTAALTRILAKLDV